MYYYIVNNKRIVGFSTQLNLLMNLGFEPLTEEQTEFYLEHPRASIREVRACQLDTPYVPPTPEVSDYAAEKKKELKEMCYASVKVTALEYAMANACLAGTALTYTGERYYSTTEAKNVMKRFMDESKVALTTYDTCSARIDAAHSIEDIDTIINEAKEAINGSN